jgi:hypothetical protein
MNVNLRDWASLQCELLSSVHIHSLLYMDCGGASRGVSARGRLPHQWAALKTALEVNLCDTRMHAPAATTSAASHFATRSTRTHAPAATASPAAG